jgi:acyl-CoA reductase-like NAD-dependent aldehyde dehydrogenase
VNLITGEGPVVGAAVVQHPGVDAIGFTGSSRTGRLVAAAAAEKPCFLELGGNGPTIVLGDADLALAAKRIAWGSFTNAGQICTSTERVLADASIAGELAARLADEAASVRLGHPLDEATTMGPMHTAAGAARALGQIERARERGALVLAGGGLQPGSPTEHYFEPTVVDRVPAESDLHVDETFAPVAPIVHFASIQDLGPLVRASSYGLSGAIFSRDVARAMQLAEHLPCGIVNINETSAYWEPQIPAGGVSGKLSGHGRTAGRWAIEEMTEPRTIVVSLPDDEDEAGIGMTGPVSEAGTPAT